MTFLIGSGADPTVENRRGRTPLDFAEYRAKKNPEALECQEIVDFLRHWEAERYGVDDAAVINAAKEIWGLDGGGKKNGIFGKVIEKIIPQAAPMVRIAEKVAANPKAITANVAINAAAGGVGGLLDGLRKTLEEKNPVDAFKVLIANTAEGFQKGIKAGLADGLVGDDIKKALLNSPTLKDVALAGAVELPHSPAEIRDVIIDAVIGSSIGSALGGGLPGAIAAVIIGKKNLVGFVKIMKDSINGVAQAETKANEALIKEGKLPLIMLLPIYH
ncbi:MAG: hypothetical protein LBB05_01235 [Puniceicoccales bacterium]|nr:hypothetical protein [Puniceicoccales bacterium]